MNLRRRLPILAAALMLVLAVGCSSNKAETPVVTDTRLQVEPAATATSVGQTAATSAATLVRTPTTTAALGRLNWGIGTQGLRRTDAELRSVALGQGTSELRRQTRRILEVAEQSLGNQIFVVAAIQREGILFSDPRYRASDAAIKSIDDIYTWAMCARAADVALADRCTQRVGEGLDAWSSTYRSMGNPINDSFLIKVIQAVDLTCPIASPERCARWRAWGIELAHRGDDFYAAMKPTDGRYANNWASWRLGLAPV